MSLVAIGLDRLLVTVVVARLWIRPATAVHETVVGINDSLVRAVVGG